MAGVADNAVGAILEIPDSALNKIKDAEKYIRDLGATSTRVARSVRKDWGETALTGLDAFIKKVKEANLRIGSLKMPTIDSTGFATSISAIAQAMAAVGQSSVDGAKNFNKIANSIAKLTAAQPNPQLFQDIANGIAAIGNTAPQTIANVSQLAQAMAQLARDIRTVQNAQRSQSDGTASAAQYNKLYKEQADLVRQINTIKAKGSNATLDELTTLTKVEARYREIDDQLNKLNKKKQTAASTLADWQGEQRLNNAWSRTTASGAINYAQQAKSLRELQDAYKNLKAVMNTVDPKSAAWQQMNTVLQQTKGKIDEIRRAMGEFQNQTRNVGDSLGRLKGQLAAAFSVGAIMGYLKKMVEVRGQFELQNVALRAILQNKDEADKIFMQVQQMALQSPFSIMQMTTFTKQLAAYRIESEKLVDTTKMLADVSAGLGVDMGRLILAYGQVKSANYLRATEIRQFTEAGLNIAGELATYFSELQGKMVSVGDVMEMVTKRMVRFEDVEEVFKRVTSAGGLFYDMQKKQSNTISGMIQRITDAWQIMMNDIGKSNQGLIRDVLDLVRQLISHWRMLVPIIKTVGGLMVGAFAVKSIYAALMGMTKMVAALKAITGGLNAMRAAAQTANLAFSTTGIGALITLGLTLASVFMGLNAEADKLNEELGRIGSESLDDMNESVANYIKLADTIRSSNTSYTERQEAIEELNRTYKDILPTYLKEKEYIDANADSYSAATKKIKEYYQAKEYEKKVEAIRESSDYTKMLEHLKGLGERMVEYGWFDEAVSKEMVSSFMEQLANEFMSGETEATMEAVANRLREYFGKHLAETGKYVKNWGQDFIEGGTLFDILGEAYGLDDLEDALDRYAKINSSLKEVQYGLTTAKSIEEQYAAAAKMHAKEVVDSAQEQINKINAQIQAYFALKTELDKLRAKGQWTAEEKERMVALQGKIEQASASFFKMTNDVIPGLDRAFLSNINNVFDLEKALDTVSQRAFPTLAAQGINALKPVKGEVNALTQAVNMLLTQMGIAGQLAGNKGPYSAKDAPMMLTPEEQQKWADKQNEIWRKEQQTLQDRVRERKKSNQEILQDEAKRFGTEKALSDKQLLIQERTNKEYANDLRALAKTKEETLKDWDAGDARARKLMGVTSAEIEQMRKEVKFLQSVAKEYDPYDDKAKHKKAKGKDPELEMWKNRIKAVQDYYDAREKARKNLSASEAEAQQVTSFEQLWKELGLDKIKGLSLNDLIAQGFDPKTLQSDLVSALEQLKTLIPAKYEDVRKEIERTIAKEKIEIQFKIKEEDFKKLKSDLDEMFANYELSEELKKLGVSVDLTYMVGGKPTTLEDIRNEIARLKAEGGDKADALEKIKILEEAEKKITQMELKEQKERLKNYEKYLKKAYSDSAKVQLEYFVKLQQMQEDFAKAEKDLKEQLANPETSAEDKLKIQKALENLPNQASRAAKGMREEMEKELDKLNLDKLLKSPLFSEMFQDLGSMTNKVLDTMLDKIRDIQKSANDLSLSQIRQLAQYAEKIENAKLDNSPFKEAYNAIKKAYELRAKGITAKSASDALAVSEEELERLETLKDDISLILGIKEKSYQIDNDMVTVGDTQHKLTAQQKTLLDKNTSELNEQLDILEDQSGALDGSIKKQKQIVTINAKNVQVYKNALTATQKLANALKKAAEAGKVAIDAVTNGMQMFGKEVSEADQVWLDFTKDMMDAGVELAIMFVALGATINNALGIIGIISTALTFVAGLFKAIFQSHDKRLEKQIEGVQDRVDSLSKAFEKLQKSIERAFNIASENRLTEQAIDNLEAQKRAYEEMIRLEEAKKKTDDDKIKDYKDKLEDLAEAEEELYEKRREKWGSTNDVGGEANAWLDTWLDSYKENGDGLDALGDKWDEFYENLVKKQAASKVLGARMDSWVKQINDAIDKNMGSEYDYIDLFKQIGAKMKEEFQATNEDLKKIFEYAGIGGGAGNLILSDLQKGIQNITEPQAAAIEAYLNSMRFAVFRHTEQLDTLIATIQMQYGSGAENPVVTELKGIRGVLDDIYGTLKSVVKRDAGKTYIQIG